MANHGNIHGMEAGVASEDALATPDESNTEGSSYGLSSIVVVCHKVTV
jgi:hypothetical protein